MVLRIFSLSLLLHVLLLLGVATSLHFERSVEDIPPEAVTPAYLYKNNEPPPEVLEQPPGAQTPSPTEQETSPLGLKKSAAKHQAIQYDNKPLSLSNDSDFLHMVGEKKAAKPLILLLGRAISKQLKYPKSAYDFRLTGTSSIGFNMHPDGTLTDIQLVQTSGSEVLDKAALMSLRSVPPITKASLYLQEATFLVVGIIFG